MSAPALPRVPRIRPRPPVNVLVGIDPVHCRPSHDAAGLDAHHRIRHAVFVAEQGLFTGSDVDAHDARTDVIHVLALHAGRPAGAVRLYPTGPDEWLGDRLAVLPEFRAANIGAPLVRCAVAAAGARGARLMRAHVQVANERFFHRLGWRTDGPVETYVGHPHVPMCIEPAALCPWLAGATPR
ncbi:MSMEG_0567/Sll0786 family nitrogen starvation N-acetyltransferase [Pseudonocardia sp. CA-142604]|uniref:MSMEG_0567/Sll0786 family nitrogen starvation N-acetyltransferase n=1 Tax=Pseudonocardia sp. CA-142604 TaxID=3240024 RepID=UPI003D949FD3